MRLLFLLVLLVVYGIWQVNAISCWTCDGKCACKNSPVLEDCPWGMQCYTIRSYDQNRVVKKGCALDCYQSEYLEGRKCDQCQSDRCNTDQDNVVDFDCGPGGGFGGGGQIGSGTGYGNQGGGGQIGSGTGYGNQGGGGQIGSGTGYGNQGGGGQIGSGAGYGGQPGGIGSGTGFAASGGGIGSGGGYGGGYGGGQRNPHIGGGAGYPQQPGDIGTGAEPNWSASSRVHVSAFLMLAVAVFGVLLI